MITIDLRGKNALITGGTRGIGRAISHLFAQAGANTFAVYHADADAAVASLTERKAMGGTHQNYQADLAEPAQIASLAQQVVTFAEGHLDILVLGAGIGAQASISQTTLEQWRHVMDENLNSVFLLAKTFIPTMKSGGSIVTLGTALGRPGSDAYGAAKGGVIALTQSIAQDVGPQGIRANVIVPGSTDTSLGGAPKTEQFKEQIAMRTALRRMGEPEDIAGVVLFLCSDLARFVTGAIISVNGGFM